MLFCESDIFTGLYLDKKRVHIGCSIGRWSDLASDSNWCMQWEMHTSLIVDKALIIQEL